MKDEYNRDWFKQFNIVVNALDNRQARNHVNRMCLAADIPLVESGTAGYLGQVCCLSGILSQAMHQHSTVLKLAICFKFGLRKLFCS